jgi:hypothetical protein
MANTEYEVTPERQLLLELAVKLPLDLVRDFMRLHDPRLDPWGPRDTLRATLHDALASGALPEKDLVGFLNEAEPWTKQHVFILSSPTGLMSNWVQVDLDARLKAALSEGMAYAPDELLPEAMSIVDVRRQDAILQITAVETRIRRERRKGLDLSAQEVGDQGPTSNIPTAAITSDGTIVAIHYEAYAEVRSRGVLMFRWDLVSDEATLHITQGPSGFNYRDTFSDFAAMAAPLFPFVQFQPLDLATAVERIHVQAETTANPEATPSRLDYGTPADGSLQGTSARATLPLHADSVLSDALKHARTHGSHAVSGNLTFSASPVLTPNNPLAADVVVSVQAADGRVNFPRQYPRADLLHVLSRLRALND